MVRTLFSECAASVFAVVLIGILSGCGGSNQSQDPATAETGGDPKPAAAADDTAPSGQEAPTGCQADGDCVKNACCHATGCVPSAEAGSCDDVMCTTECKDGTMDCGKGTCACIDGACAVKWGAGAE